MSNPAHVQRTPGTHPERHRQPGGDRHRTRGCKRKSRAFPADRGELAPTFREPVAAGAPLLLATRSPGRWNAAKVGGDLCDFVALPQATGLLIADVSGKGIPAALYMMFARTPCAVAFSGRDPRPCMRTNAWWLTARRLLRHRLLRRLTRSQHKLTYASAGATWSTIAGPTAAQCRR